MVKHEKKRIQAQIDKNLANEAEEVLSKLGITPTMAINMLYKRIIANGSLPFKVELTEKEKATLSFIKDMEDVSTYPFVDVKFSDGKKKED